MSNFLDLSNIEDNDLIKELNNRGYNLKLVYNRNDVKSQLNEINKQRVEDKLEVIVLDDTEMDNILNMSLDTEYQYFSINELIFEKIVDYYG